MPTTGTALDIGQFIDTVMMGDLKKMICKHGLHYLGFGIVGCGIEFLGACIDAHPFDKEQVSRDRFESAVKALFDPMYHPYADKTSVHDLYKYLRCGMAHIMRPQGRIAFTTQAESITDGTQHLQVFTGTGKLVLVSEIFYADFAEACKKMKHRMLAGKYSKKLTDQYLTITEIEP